MSYEFKTGEGLYMNGNLIAPFEPILRRVLRHIPQDSIEDSWEEYGIEIRRCDGTMSELCFVKSLRPDYFKMWRVPDALLERDERRALTAKLQSEYEGAIKENIYEASKTGPLDEEGKSFLFGDLLLGEQRKISFNESVIKFKTNDLNRDVSHLVRQGEKYINFLPGTSEVIFYSALVGILKPYFNMAGFPIRFSIFLFGPSGHLKSSIIRKYALWLDEEQQMQILQSPYTMRSLEKRIENLKGMNFLLDDYRDASGTSARDRQRNTIDNVVRWIDSQEENANLFITGEYLEGSFSCQDRILGIEIPKKTGDELQVLKHQFSLLDKKDMISIAAVFAERIAKNSENVVNKIRTYMCSATKDNIAGDYRFNNFISCIFATEMLYREFICSGNETLSNLPKLRSAMEDIASKQNRRLRMLIENGGKTDYVYCVAKALNSPKLVFQKEKYNMDDQGAALVKDGLVIITSKNLKLLLQQQYPGRDIPLKKVIQALDEVDALESDKDKNGKKYLGRRHYCIRISSLSEYREN